MYFNSKYHGAMDPYGSWQLELYGMGPSTNPKADQLKEFNLDANWGAKNIEIGFLSPTEMDAFPNPAMDEIRRLSKLTGVKPSVHGPLDDPAGIDQKGAQNEYKRRGVVNEYTHAMDIAYKTGGEKTPVVFHASNAFPGKVYTKNGDEKKEAMGVIDQETKKFVTVVEEETKQTRDGEKTWSPDEQLRMLNYTQWSDNLQRLALDRKNMEDIKDRIQKISMKEQIDPKEIRWATGIEETMSSHMDAMILNAYNDFVKYQPDPKKIEDPYLREVVRTTLPKLNKLREKYMKEHKEYKDFRKKAYKEINKAMDVGDKRKAIELTKKLNDLELRDLNNWQHFFGESVHNYIVPSRYVPVEEFTLKPAAKTFAETAFKSYEKYGNKSPVIMIENPPAPWSFSRAEEHKKLVEKAREELVNLSRERGKPISRKQAEELIQATLDVAHYGLWKQYGYSNEDIINMSKKMAPLVGHLHVSDNFGSADSHLPPGWGNLPNGEVLKILKEQGFKGRAIIEAGGAEAKGYNPYQQSLEYFNSGLYSWAARPTWTEVGDYFWGSSMYATPGIPLPDVHSREYGGGFSGLPPATGVGKKERSGMSGTPYS